MGALLGGPVADRIGRKWSISAWCMMLHIGLIVQMTAANHKWYQSKQTLLFRSISIANSGSCCWKVDCRSWRGSAFSIGRIFYLRIPPLSPLEMLTRSTGSYVSKRERSSPDSGRFDKVNAYHKRIWPAC